MPHAPNESYAFANYVAYILYPPLYIAGPIITFNDFLWQVFTIFFTSVAIQLPMIFFSRTHANAMQLRCPPSHENSPTSRASTISYLARFLFTLLTMELILHYMYVVAIKDSSAWLGDTPLELCMIGFWNLIIVWLKVGILFIRRLGRQSSIHLDMVTSFSSLGASSAFGHS